MSVGLGPSGWKAHETNWIVSHVMYVLHPTFHNPVRLVTDRSSNFRLDTSGWGTFTIHAKAVHQDGTETHLKHDLVLLYPDGTPTLA
jgi:transcription initiation factor IIF auxiliary subunit